MKRKGYYEYDPQIYPYLLCVSIGMDEEDVNKCFEGTKGEYLQVDFDGTRAMSFGSVRKKSDKKMCSFVNFRSKAEMRMSVCCHEASHVCDAIEDYIGAKHGNEPSAYLIGWIASCINKARLSVGDFVEIVGKEEK